MYTNLIKVIENLLNFHQYETVDNILKYLDIEASGNALTEFIDILTTCKPEKQELEEYNNFQQRLKSKMVNERGEQATMFTLSRYQF